MNLILCGMMGVGKTTVGVKIAETDGRRWVDTDEMIVEKYGNISEIFARYGEPYFRGLETGIVQTIAKEDGLVVSVGGGLVLKRENCDLLKENGTLIYLRATVKTLAERLRSDRGRPLLQAEETLEERLTELLRVRAPIYERVADITVDVDGKSPETLAAEILARVNGKK